MIFRIFKFFFIKKRFFIRKQSFSHRIFQKNLFAGVIDLPGCFDRIPHLIVKKVGAILCGLLGVVWCVLDPKGYALSHYTKEELDQMGINFDHQYSLQGKCYKKFTQANARFILNSFKIAFKSRPLKWAIRLFSMGCLLALLCQIFGYRNYLDGKIPERNVL